VTTELASPGVAILADDLIWASRLSDAVTAAGGSPRRVRRTPDLEALIAAGTRLVVVDLTARAYDGVGAITAAVQAGARVLAVGQHDDKPLRDRALAAGAERVLPYRQLFERGADVFGAWLTA